MVDRGLCVSKLCILAFDAFDGSFIVLHLQLIVVTKDVGDVGGGGEDRPLSR